MFLSVNFDIFISYRRRETADKAEHLFSLLEMVGYKGQVSFDRENFDGRFDLEILQRLDDCKDFIVVLAPGTLAELSKEDTYWYEKLARCSVSEFSKIENEMTRGQVPVTQIQDDGLTLIEQEEKYTTNRKNGTTQRILRIYKLQAGGQKETKRLQHALEYLFEIRTGTKHY